MRKKGLISKAGCLPYNPDLNRKARELRNNMTPAEKKLWNEFLRRHKLTFHRQKPIDNYIVDFYCSKPQLVIEIDGDVHDTEERKEFDINRTGVLEGYSLKVLRFKNNEVFENFDGVCRAIEDEVKRRCGY